MLPKPIHDYLFNTITYAIKRQELSASSSIVLPTPALSIRSASINNSVDGASAASSSASDMFMELDDDISNEEMFGDISDIESEKMFSSFSHTKKKDKKEVDLVAKLFDEYGTKYADRKGGYTRIIKIGQRKGDAAMEVVLELV